MKRILKPEVILFFAFAAFYVPIGPGNFFAVDESMEEETAQHKC